MNVLIKLTVEGVEIEGTAELPEGRAPRRAILPTLQRLTDVVVALAERREAGEGRAISCTKGCDACCRQMVPISGTEAFGLAAVLEGMAPRQGAQILERFDEAADVLEQKGVLERMLRRKELSGEELRELDRDYFAAGVACPFLEKGACVIHKDRPLACREFLVTSPAEYCADPGSGRVRQVEVGAKLSVALAGAEGENGGGWLPLVLARRYAAGHREGEVGSAAGELEKVLGAL